MFGIVRPCRHRLRGPLFGEWMGHLCGLCLTLRDQHGQAARLVTNYDGLLVSVLTEAQDPDTAPHRRAGPCALRGFRRADVLDTSAAGARLAAAVSLVLAAGKVRDHVADGDGAYARRMVAAGAGLAASRWQAAGERSAKSLGFDTGLLTSAVRRQAELERTAGLTLADVTEPTEKAVSAAFAHTAVLAGQPRNATALAEAGRQFGRIAHLLDAVEDVAQDRDNGAYNPLLATATTPATAREHLAGSVSRLRGAVGDLELARPGLAESLLVREVQIAVDKVFADMAQREVAAIDGWPARPLGRPSGMSLPCVVAAGPCRRRRGGCGDCCGDCCGDSCCEGCCEACGECDCGSCCDCTC